MGDTAFLPSQLVVHVKRLITRSQRGVILWFVISSQKDRAHVRPHPSSPRIAMLQGIDAAVHALQQCQTHDGCAIRACYVVPFHGRSTHAHVQAAKAKISQVLVLIMR